MLNINIDYTAHPSTEMNKVCCNVSDGAAVETAEKMIQHYKDVAERAGQPFTMTQTINQSLMLSAIRLIVQRGCIDCNDIKFVWWEGGVQIEEHPNQYGRLARYPRVDHGQLIVMELIQNGLKKSK